VHSTNYDSRSVMVGGEGVEAHTATSSEVHCVKYGIF